MTSTANTQTALLTDAVWLPEVDPIMHKWFHDQGPLISAAAEVIGDAILRFCRDRDNPRAWLSIETLEKVTHRSKSTIIRATTELQESGHFIVEQEDLSNGFCRNEYIPTGLRSEWEVTVPKVRMDRKRRYALELQNVELTSAVADQASQIEDLRRQLAEARGEEYSGPDFMTPNVSSKYERNSPSLTTDPPVSQNMTPEESEPEDTEAAEIEQALQDNWRNMGQTWQGAWPAARSYFTLLGRCRSSTCKACPRYKDSPNPHRTDFWRQLALHQPPQGEDRVVCISHGGEVETRRMGEDGVCLDCHEILKEAGRA